MTTRHRYYWLDPPPQPAPPAVLDGVLPRFIDRFVAERWRERAHALFCPMRKRSKIRELVAMLDPTWMSERPPPGLDRTRAGVFIEGNRTLWTTTLGVAIDHLEGDEVLFLTTDAAIGVALHDIGPRHYLTRR